MPKIVSLTKLDNDYNLVNTTDTHTVMREGDDDGDKKDDKKGPDGKCGSGSCGS